MKNYVLYLAEAELSSRKVKKNILYPLHKLGCVIGKWFKVNIACELELLKTDFILTNRCTLNCKECTYLIPYYKNREDYQYEMLLNDIWHISKVFNKIYRIVLVGGEPLLYNRIEDILRILISDKKYKQIDIITNGTIMPSDSLFDLISGERCTLSISNYGAISKYKEKIIEKCVEKGVTYQIDENFMWCSLGGFDKRNREKTSNKKLFSECRESRCNQILNGRLFVCPRSAAGRQLQLFEYKEDESVYLRESNKKVIRKKLKKFYAQNLIKTCDYCDGITLRSKKILPAEQLKRK